MNPAVVAWVEATRATQGLPPRVEDDQVLDKVAAIATSSPAARVEESEGDAAA